jgi:hypothetical protein
MKAYDSVKREELYHNLIEYGICRKLTGIIEICSNRTYNTVFIVKYVRKFSYSEWPGTG